MTAATRLRGHAAADDHRHAPPPCFPLLGIALLRNVFAHRKSLLSNHRIPLVSSPIAPLLRRSFDRDRPTTRRVAHRNRALNLRDLGERAINNRLERVAISPTGRGRPRSTFHDSMSRYEGNATLPPRNASAASNSESRKARRTHVFARSYMPRA